MTRSYRTEGAAENIARRMRDQGHDAYVYACQDCTVVVHSRDKNPYASNRMYAGTTTMVVPAWHIGVDTGAPWHQNRTSCDVSDVVEQCREELRQQHGWDAA